MDFEKITEIVPSKLAEFISNPKIAYRKKVSLVSKIHSGKVKVLHDYV